MLLLIGAGDESALFESHSHLGRGGIIAAAGLGKLKEMTLYIDFMARTGAAIQPLLMLLFCEVSYSLYLY